MMGPTMLERGSEALKMTYLPRITSGEIEMALGYTEPQAGSDLASLELRAEKSDGYYILNGQKTFNSVGHYADAFWLGVRTQKIVPKHRGISMIIADARTPGITIRPLWRMDGGRANEIFFDDVRVPEGNLVGEENKGWYYLMEALNRERIFATHIGTLQRILDDLVQYARETEYNGKLIAGNPLIRHSLAEMAIETKITRLLCIMLYGWTPIIWK